MDKGLFFMTLSLVCVWLILDDFFGRGYVTHLSRSLIPNDIGKPLPFIDKNQAAKDKKKAKKKVESDPKLNKDEKDFLKDNIDNFYGDVEVH